MSNWLEDMKDSDMANLNKITPKQKYICTSSYLAIPEGSIVQVEIGSQVYITYDKRITCTNEFVLAMNFTKVEG